VTVLSPGALFTHTHHDGLLADRSRHFLMVLSFVIPFQINMMGGLQSSRIGSLTSSKRFGAPAAFLTFNYYHCAHPKVVRLLRKHKLHDDVDANAFFAASVMHGVDHTMAYRVMNQFPLRASYNILVPPGGCQWCLARALPNVVFFSTCAKDSAPLPIFQELHRELALIDSELADMTTSSTSF
jgi:hypothetical protein